MDELRVVELYERIGRQVREIHGADGKPIGIVPDLAAWRAGMELYGIPREEWPECTEMLSLGFAVERGLVTDDGE